jgi:hypothetical protein
MGVKRAGGCETGISAQGRSAVGRPLPSQHRQGPDLCVVNMYFHAAARDKPGSGTTNNMDATEYYGKVQGHGHGER